MADRNWFAAARDYSCSEALEALDATRKVGTTLLNLPSSSYLLPSPKGVVLVIGAWNFPLQLLSDSLRRRPGCGQLRGAETQ